MIDVFILKILQKMCGRKVAGPSKRLNLFDFPEKMKKNFHAKCPKPVVKSRCRFWEDRATFRNDFSRDNKQVYHETSKGELGELTTI